MYDLCVIANVAAWSVVIQDPRDCDLHCYHFLKVLVLGMFWRICIKVYDMDSIIVFALFASFPERGSHCIVCKQIIVN